MIKREIIEKLPKTDLHVHLDGSVRLETLIELAKEYGVTLPSYTSGGLMETVYKEKYGSLEEYLQGFGYAISVLQSEPALERAAYELARDNQDEGVRYVEVRFAPQLHVHSHLSMENVLRSVNRGLEKARSEFNLRKVVASGEEPEFEYSIVVCALRYFEKGLCEYYDAILGVHRFTRPRHVFSMASRELAQAAVEIRSKYALPIMGFDLAGREAGNPAVNHRQGYQYAHRNFLMKTVHAGEAYGPESIFQAITELHADRIGHGTHLLHTDMITNPAIEDREKYIEELAQYIADRRITMEICLTSNMQTNPRLERLEDHPYLGMKERRLSTTFCTDNRTVSRTTVSNEIETAIKHLGVTPAELKRCVIYGFKRSFFPGTYLQKRRYVRRIIDFYESLEALHPEVRPNEETD
ncbi:MAG: adenosine deaminase family protein [Deltaproteobacteria bacterium]|nr:adenosine deaminase family protein [Deltaproteobacteria bacterium]